MSTSNDIIFKHKHTSHRYFVKVVERFLRFDESVAHEILHLGLLKVLDNVVIDVPLLGFFYPVLIVDCTWTRMRNEFTVDLWIELTFLLQIFDTVVGVAANTDDDFGIENFNGLSQIFKTDFRQLRFRLSLYRKKCYEVS